MVLTIITISKNDDDDDDDDDDDHRHYFYARNFNTDNDNKNYWHHHNLVVIASMNVSTIIIKIFIKLRVKLIAKLINQNDIHNTLCSNGYLDDNGGNEDEADDTTSVKVRAVPSYSLSGSRGGRTSSRYHQTIR